MLHRNSKEVKIVESLILSAPHKEMDLQALEFEKLTGKSRATFYRYKRLILLGKTRRLGKTRCYFCETPESLIIHHRDKDRQNNKDNNLLIVCVSCHQKLHELTN